MHDAYFTDKMFDAEVSLPLASKSSVKNLLYEGVQPGAASHQSITGTGSILDGGTVPSPDGDEPDDDKRL